MSKFKCKPFLSFFSSNWINTTIHFIILSNFRFNQKIALNISFFFGIHARRATNAIDYWLISHETLVRTLINCIEYCRFFFLSRCKWVIFSTNHFTNHSIKWNFQRLVTLNAQWIRFFQRNSAKKISRFSNKIPTKTKDIEMVLTQGEYYRNDNPLDERRCDGHLILI